MESYILLCIHTEEGELSSVGSPLFCTKSQRISFLQFPSFLWLSHFLWCQGHDHTTLSLHCTASSFYPAGRSEEIDNTHFPFKKLTYNYIYPIIKKLGNVTPVHGDGKGYPPQDSGLENSMDCI